MKTWYLSKTLWLNVIVITALIAQTYTGFIIDPEAQAGLLAVINLILRAVTKAPLDWATPGASGGNSEGGYIRLSLLSLLLVFAAIIALTGCATTSPTAPPSAKDSPQVLTGKSLLAVKSTIVVAATTVDTLCKNGTLKPDVCTQAKATYEQTKPAYDAAVDAYLLMTSVGGDSGDFSRSLVRVQVLAASLLSLSEAAR